MKSVGIIAEYNPFHNGHWYHLQKVKEMFPNSVVILILSGIFTQRGDVSILDKWTKTQIALEAGIDLVVELPFPFATASADIFAEGAIQLLHYLQVTDLVFGSESNDLEGLKKLVDVQLHDPTFPSLVQVYLRMGYNYPTALSLVLKELTGISFHLPNDILGISYLKSIASHQYHINAHSIKRTSNYHDLSTDSSIISATAIRKQLYDKKTIIDYVPNFVATKLPKDTISMENYFDLLKYKIISDDELEKYTLVESGLSEQLKKHICYVHSIDELIQKLKCKNLTYNRLARMLLYILCGYTKEMARQIKDVPYIRLLGFSSLGQRYLNKIKKETNIPIISKYRRNIHPILNFEYQVTKIYALGFSKTEQQKLIKQETQQAPIRKEQNEINCQN